METALVALFIADLYLIVYYRLQVAHCQARNGASVAREGILMVLTPSGRGYLKPQERKYLRRYWGAVGLLFVLIGLGVWLRYPIIAEAARSAIHSGG